MSLELAHALAALRQRDGIATSEAIRRGLLLLLKQRGITVKASKKGGTRPATRRSK